MVYFVYRKFDAIDLHFPIARHLASQWFKGTQRYENMSMSIRMLNFSMGFLWQNLNGVPIEIHIDLFYRISMEKVERSPLQVLNRHINGFSMGKGE